MSFVDKDKILEFMENRKDALHLQISMDFGGGLEGRLYAHNELKYWKEAIERGEFDNNEIYIILSRTQPEIVDFTFYTNKEAVSRRVDELNSVTKVPNFWYITLYSNSRNSKKMGKVGEN